MKKNLRKTLLAYVWITLASAIYAVGFNWCYEPNQIGFGGITGVAQIINAWPNSRLLNYPYLQQLRDMLPAILLSTAMGLLVYTLNFLGLGDFATLALQVLAGVGIYLLGSLLFKLDSFRYILSILKNLLHRGGAAKE